MAETKRRLSETERDERRRRDRERLQAAAGQLLSSEGWQRWLRVRSQAGLARLCLVIWRGCMSSALGRGHARWRHVVGG
jgi:hypothetical protein